MSPPTALVFDGGADDLPPRIAALRDRMIRPADPVVARRHAAAAARAVAAQPTPARGPQHLRTTPLEELTPGFDRVRRAGRAATRVSAVAAAVVLGTAGLAAAQILPAPARTLFSTLKAIPVPWDEADPASPTDIPAPPEPPAKSRPAVVVPAPDDSDRSTTTSSTSTTSTTVDPTTSTTEAPTTSTTQPGSVAGTETPTTSTTVPGTSGGDDGGVEGTETPTSTTVPADGDGEVTGTEVPTGGSTTTTTPTTTPAAPADLGGTDTSGDPANGDPAA